MGASVSPGGVMTKGIAMQYKTKKQEKTTSTMSVYLNSHLFFYRGLTRSERPEAEVAQSVLQSLGPDPVSSVKLKVTEGVAREEEKAIVLISETLMSRGIAVELIVMPHGPFYPDSCVSYKDALSPWHRAPGPGFDGKRR